MPCLLRARALFQRAIVSHGRACDCNRLHRCWFHPWLLSTGLQAHTAEGILLETADAVLVVGADTLQREGTFNGTAHLAGKPLCEVCVQQDFQTLSSDPTLRVDGDLSGLLMGASKLVTARAGFAVPELEAYRAKVRELYFPRPKVTFALHDILEVSRRLLPDNGVAFGETGIAVIFLETLWPVYSPNTFFGTAGGRTMGLTIPAILGAKLARPDLPMIGFCGDGSTLMRLGELELFSRLNIAVPLVIINDQGEDLDIADYPEPINISDSPHGPIVITSSTSRALPTTSPSTPGRTVWFTRSRSLRPRSLPRSARNDDVAAEGPRPGRVPGVHCRQQQCRHDEHARLPPYLLRGEHP